MKSTIALVALSITATSAFTTTAPSTVSKTSK